MPAALPIDLPVADLVVDELPAAHRRLCIAVVTETFPPEVDGVALSIHRYVESLRGNCCGCASTTAPLRLRPRASRRCCSAVCRSRATPA